MTQAYFQDLARPMNGSRNGLYMPKDVHRECPSEESKLDPYRIVIGVQTAEEKGPSILELLKDKTRLLKRI